MKKHKPQKFGINPEWIKTYIINPLCLLFMIVVIMIIAINKYNAYVNEKTEKESIKVIARAERDIEERLRQESIKEKQEQQAEKERQKESIAQIEVERRKTNTLYENQVSKKVLPIGTYLKNTELKKVGKVVGYYGLEVITNNEWNTILDENGVVADNIKIIGYAEYIKSLKKQKENEEKKHQIENAYKTNQIYEQERAEQKKAVMKYYGDTKHTHILFEGKKYKIKNVDGRELRLIEKGTKNTIMIDAYDTRIKVIGVNEYYEEVQR